MKKHCCACSKVPYCHIGKAFWCTYHKRWYARRNELTKKLYALDAKLRSHSKKFEKR